jgi:hypothetical protein
VTVMIPEAAGAVEGTAARAGAGARGARGARVARRPRATGGPPRQRRGLPPGSGYAAGTAAASMAASRRGDQAQDQERPGVFRDRGGYHRIVIAEFIATIIIIAMSPFLVPRTTGSADPETEAKAAVRDLALSAPLVRLTAACAVFFVLALLSTGARTGKIAAAFGGLVTLGALINATDMWTAVGQVFAGAQARKKITPDTGLGASTAAAAGGAVG